MEWVRTLAVPGSGCNRRQKLRHLKRYFVDTDLSLTVSDNKESFLVASVSAYLRRAQETMIKSLKGVTFSGTGKQKGV